MSQFASGQVEAGALSGEHGLAISLGAKDQVVLGRVYHRVRKEVAEGK